jgi:hypothetical protein
VEDLGNDVGTNFGVPRLVGATGSFLEGFDHRDSVIDVHVFVDDGTVTDVPIPSFTLGQTVFCCYLSTGWVEEAVSTVLAGALPRGGWTKRDDWYADRRALFWLGRVAAGPVISGEQVWKDLRQDLRRAYPAYSALWWRAECLRRLTAARILAESRPLVAAQRYCDAGLAALESAMAQAGEATVWPHWLGAKVRRSGSDSHERALRRLLRTPGEPSAAAAYQHDAEEIISSLFAHAPLDPNPHLSLSMQPGVTSWQFRDRSLVQRWGMTGVEVDASTAAKWQPGEVVWAGRQSDLAGDVKTCLLENMFWAAVSEECAE